MGLVIGATIVAGQLTIGGVTFDVDTLVAASVMVVVGFQSMLFWLFTRVYAHSEGFLPEELYVKHVVGKLSLERGIVLGAIIGIAGLVGLIFSLTYWQAHEFSALNYEHALRLMVPSATALVVSYQLVLGTFFLSILGIRQARHTPIGAEATIKVSDKFAEARRLAMSSPNPTHPRRFDLALCRRPRHSSPRGSPRSLHTSRGTPVSWGSCSCGRLADRCRARLVALLRLVAWDSF